MKRGRYAQGTFPSVFAGMFLFSSLFFALLVPFDAFAWDLKGSCSGTPASVSVGETVTWKAVASSTMKPSEGHYAYVWSGTDGLSSNTKTVTKSYTTAGTKTATVQIIMVLNEGGSESITKTCSVKVIPPPPLVGSCIANPSLVGIGENVSWSATASGGMGTYSYSWSGDDGLSGTLSSVLKSYTSAGIKNASVAITSGSQTINVTCTATVDTPPLGDLIGSCTATPHVSHVGDSVSWSANASGGDGSYHYHWSGTDGLEGASASVSKAYNTIGTKDATVVITSGTQRVTATCATTIQDTPPPSVILDGVCNVLPTSAEIGMAVVWTATGTGGSGTYTFHWTGDEGLSGTTNTVHKTYTATGNKNATVTIFSGTDSITKTCSVQITHTPPSSGNLVASCAVHPSSIRSGESVDWSAHVSGGTGTYTYSWSGDDGLSGTTPVVSKTYPSTGTKNGMVMVTSGSEVVSASCAANVLPPPGCTTNCGGGGGGFNPPTVVLLKKPPEAALLSYVYLSQIPYTGFGDWYKIALFLLVLGLWSASAVYFFRSKLWRKKEGSPISSAVSRDTPMQNVPGDAEEVVEIVGEDISSNQDWLEDSSLDITMQETHNSREQGKAFASLHLSDQKSRNAIVDIIAAEAERSRAIISEEGMKLIAEKGSFDAAKTLSLVKEVIERAEERYNRDDGWLLLNKEKVVTSLAFKFSSSREKEELSGPRTPEPARETKHIETVLKETQPLYHPDGKGHAGNVDSALFVTWLATGNKDEAIRFLKTLRGQHGAAESFLKKIILDLDVVYRTRFDDTEEALDERLMHTVSGLSNEALEQLISVLFSMVDQRYKSTSLGIKLALMRVADSAKRR